MHSLRHCWALLGALALISLAGCDRPEVKQRAEELAQGKPLFSLPPGPVPSPAGYQLILDHEVGGGRPYYDKKLRHPVWPGLASGVTAGVGVDCGYSSPTVIRDTWSKLQRGWQDDLAATSGVTGSRAKSLIPGLRHIDISWPIAEDVFQRVTIARHWQVTKRTFPGVEKLRPEAQWALLSLVYNRGGALEGSRRREMKRIRELVPLADYAGIARQIRLMNRIWAGTEIETGMRRRRGAEADMIERCLQEKKVGDWELSRRLDWLEPKTRIVEGWRFYPTVTAIGGEAPGQYDFTFEIRGGRLF